MSDLVFAVGDILRMWYVDQRGLLVAVALLAAVLFGSLWILGEILVILGTRLTLWRDVRQMRRAIQTLQQRYPLTALQQDPALGQAELTHDVEQFDKAFTDLQQRVDLFESGRRVGRPDVDALGVLCNFVSPEKRTAVARAIFRRMQPVLADYYELAAHSENPEAREPGQLFERYRRQEAERSLATLHLQKSHTG